MGFPGGSGKWGLTKGKKKVKKKDIDQKKNNKKGLKKKDIDQKKKKKKKGKKNPPANAGDKSLSPGSGRCPGEGNGNPLQYSCLKNPRDRGAWWTIIHGGRRRVGHDSATKQQ